MTIVVVIKGDPDYVATQITTLIGSGRTILSLTKAYAGFIVVHGV